MRKVVLNSREPFESRRTLLLRSGLVPAVQEVVERIGRDPVQRAFLAEEKVVIDAGQDHLCHGADGRNAQANADPCFATLFDELRSRREVVFKGGLPLFADVLVHFIRDDDTIDGVAALVPVLAPEKKLIEQEVGGDGSHPCRRESAQIEHGMFALGDKSFQFETTVRLKHRPGRLYQSFQTLDQGTLVVAFFRQKVERRNACEFQNIRQRGPQERLLCLRIERPQKQFHHVRQNGGAELQIGPGGDNLTGAVDGDTRWNARWLLKSQVERFMGAEVEPCLAGNLREIRVVTALSVEYDQRDPAVGMLFVPAKNIPASDPHRGRLPRTRPSTKECIQRA